MTEPETTGEVRVTASSNGRQITLDPLRLIPVTVDVREVESTLPCGLRVEWASGTIGGQEFSIESGAGVGSRWLTIDYEGKDYCMDISDFVQAFVRALEVDA